MKRILLCLLFLLMAPAVLADTLTFEGKVSAQIARHVSVPFPMLVDTVYISIGDNVEKSQRLLAYHLDARDARAFQSELITGGSQADFKYRAASQEQELLHTASARQSSAVLSAKGLGSSSQSAKDNRNYQLAQEKAQAIKQQREASKADFALRLRELETYFGHSLKTGQKLPPELYLTAPIGGTVVEISPQARPGGRLDANVSAMTIAVLNPIQVQIQVYETEVSRLHVGQQVTVEIVNRDALKLPGKISMLSWQPTDATIAVPSFYYAWVDVENPDQLLKPGYKVLVHVDTEAR